MDKLKKVKSLVVSIVILLNITMLNSCTAIKNNFNNNSNFNYKNCVKYTLNYKEKLDSLTQDSVFVTGKTRICISNNVLPGVEITVYNEEKKEIIKVSSDKKGNFAFKLKSGYYYMIALSSGNHLQIPITYFGDFGNILEMNMFLASHPVL